jgi:putative PIG3 family NAD(P)H quinone oxidoreductase
MRADATEGSAVKAVVVRTPGGPEALEVIERPDLEAGPGELLVEVAATALNRADVLQRKGLYPPPEGATDVLGLEMAGEVAALGEGVEGWKVGDRVCAVLAGGGYAEQVTVPASCALPVPDGVDLVEAAAIPEVFTTAYDNVFNRAFLAEGETLLVHGGASGVGTAATQLAKWFGCTVYVTAGSKEKLDACAELGADAGISYRDEDFVARTRELTGGRGVDVVLDIIGADYLERNLKALALEGRLVVIGLMGGAKAPLNLGVLLARRLTVTGSTLRARSVAEKAELAGQMREEVWPGFSDGALRPVVDRILPLEEAAAAHQAMERSEHIGKIVLQVRE